LDSLLEILNTNNKRLALLHFAGHSDTDWLQLDSGKAYAAGIAAKLQQCPNLQLVFLNGCNNEGLVKALVQVGIPHVIGTRQTIIDRMALAFSKGFYRALLYQAKGVSVALEQARDDVRTGYSGDFRSLDIEDFDESPEWAWFGESQIQDWRFEDIAHECNRLPRLDETKELPTKPFKNLYYYEKADAEIFFGRCKETLKVIQALDTAAESVLLLHGGTGVGKSSFLQASLLPRLESPSRKQEVKYKRYSDLPHHENVLVEVFGTDDLSAIRSLLNNGAETGLSAVWIIDQFEEVFFDERQRSMGENGLNDADTLFTAIRALYYDAEQPKPRAKIILSLRKDWTAEARDICSEYGIGITDVFLKPLGRAAIVEVVESLTRTNRLQAKYHLRIDDPEEQSFANLVANELLADKSSNIAPTLQIMLTRFWARVENQQERVWDKTLFQQEQREGSLLEDFLQSQLKGIAENCRDQEHGDWGRQAYESGLLLDVLYQHTSERGTANTISAGDYDRLYSHIPYRQELLRALRNRYLLIEPQTNERGASSKETRLAHDTLAKLVRVKFDESDLPGQQVYRILKMSCQNWVDNQSPSLLLDKHRVGVVEQSKIGRFDFSVDELNYFIASKKSVKWQLWIREIVVFFMLLSAILVSFVFLS
ncbi:MAG: nSTAND1 domain-containing NTPase, partial [bacterium]